LGPGLEAYRAQEHLAHQRAAGRRLGEHLVIAIHVAAGVARERSLGEPLHDIGRAGCGDQFFDLGRFRQHPTKTSDLRHASYRITCRRPISRRTCFPGSSIRSTAAYALARACATLMPSAVTPSTRPPEDTSWPSGARAVPAWNTMTSFST